MVTVLEDVAFRVDGLRWREQASIARDEVVFDLADCSLAQGLWTIPALDGIAAAMPAARLFVRADGDLAELIVAHLRAQRHHAVRLSRSSAPAPRALWIELSPRVTTRPRLSRDGDHVRVPSRPFPRRMQHAWGHWVDGARACGFDARATRPQLLLRDREQARAARRWVRERFGRGGRTLIALLPSASSSHASSWGVPRFVELGRELASRLDASLLCQGALVPGATSLDDLDIVTTAYVLGLVAVAIGDADGVVHLAAAVGASAVSLHGEGSAAEEGVASELGAAISADRCLCSTPRSGCLACIAPSRVAVVAEQLAGRRWPWDRLAQLGLGRTGRAPRAR